MSVSARNVFKGKVTSVKDGAVNAEVELTLAGDDKIVAIVTEGSVKDLGIAVGKEAIAYVKAPWVMLLAGPQSIKFSARNQLTGKVSVVHKGAVNSEVGITLAGGTTVFAVVTNEAVLELGLKEGVEATALIKASHVILGVPAAALAPVFIQISVRRRESTHARRCFFGGRRPCRYALTGATPDCLGGGMAADAAVCLEQGGQERR